MFLIKGIIISGVQSASLVVMAQEKEVNHSQCIIQSPRLILCPAPGISHKLARHLVRHWHENTTEISNFNVSISGNDDEEDETRNVIELGIKLKMDGWSSASSSSGVSVLPSRCQSLKYLPDPKVIPFDEKERIKIFQGQLLIIQVSKSTIYLT